MSLSLESKNIYSLPDIDIPSSEKKEDYHKQFILGIANKCLNGSYASDYSIMEESEKFYNGTQSGDEFSFLQNAEDGTTLPAKWININKIRVKVNTLVGQLLGRHYKIDVSSINSEARIRKLDERENARVDNRILPDIEEIEKDGPSLMPNAQRFESEQELDDYFDYSYKEKTEQVISSALKYVANKNNWDYERMSMFRDLHIHGRCFSKTELIDGIPFTRRIDPKTMVFDRHATNDFLTDSSYFGEMRYMSLAAAAEKYKLNKEEVSLVKNSYKNRPTSLTSAVRSSDSVHSMNQTSGFDFIREESDGLHVMVLEAYWDDIEKLRYKDNEDSLGQPHVFIYDSEAKEKQISKEAKTKSYQVWRKGVLIGGEVLKEWGLAKNMTRENEDPSKTECPYKGLIPNYLNFTSISLVDQLKQLQNLKDIITYNIQLAMARAGAKGFVYDVSQLPDDWDVSTALKYLKIAGIAFINSRVDGIPGSFNQFQTFDMTLSESVKQYIELAAMFDREMDAVTGINETRQGAAPSPSSTLGATQMALAQSNLTTEQNFSMFYNYCGRVLTYQAGLLKIAWADQQRFSLILGDEGLKHLSDDVDLSLDDYAVFVKEIPPSMYDAQAVKEIMTVAVNSQQITLVDALKIMREPDVDMAIRSLEKAINKRQREAQAQAEAQAQQEQQSAMAMEQMKLQDSQNKMMSEREKMVLDKELSRYNELASIRAKTKGDLSKSYLENKFNLAITKENSKGKSGSK